MRLILVLSRGFQREQGPFSNMLFNPPPKTEPKLWGKVKTEDDLWEVAHFAKQGNRRTMEDAHGIQKSFVGGQKSSLFVGIFDGHCGEKCAQFVSETLPKTILKELKEEQPVEETKLAIKKAFFDVDSLWLEKAKTESKEEKPWEDAVVTIINGKDLYVANTGDSFALMSKDGKLQTLTIDQKPEDPKEKERIEKAGGTVVNGRIGGNLSVARAFGNYPYKRKEYNLITVEPVIDHHRITPETEWILLSCDGLIEDMSIPEAHEFISMRMALNKPVGEIVKELVDEALDLGSQDNVSVVLIKFGKGYQKILKQIEKNEQKTSHKQSDGQSDKKSGTLVPKQKGTSLRRSLGMARDDDDDNPEESKKGGQSISPSKQKKSILPWSQTKSQQTFESPQPLSPTSSSIHISIDSNQESGPPSPKRRVLTELVAQPAPKKRAALDTPPLTNSPSRSRDAESSSLSLRKSNVDTVQRGNKILPAGLTESLIEQQQQQQMTASPPKKHDREEREKREEKKKSLVEGTHHESITLKTSKDKDKERESASPPRGISDEGKKGSKAGDPK